MVAGWVDAAPEDLCDRFMSGPGGRIRTCDPHNPIVVRYQTALRPESRTDYAMNAEVSMPNGQCVATLQLMQDFFEFDP
jgi:hypothetical protein